MPGTENINLKNCIKESLSGDMLTNALNFANFLNVNDMEAFGEHGAVNYKNEVVCYMHLDGGEEEPAPWTIWTEGDYSNENILIDERAKEIAWANVNICASCGDCAPGQTKMIFGKTFDNVCNADIAFYRPDSEILECVKKLLLIRKGSISK